MSRGPGSSAAGLGTSLAVVVLTVAMAACGVNGGLNGSSTVPLDRSPIYVAEFDKIDTAHKGRITLDQALAYYTAKFSELDTARRGYLGVAELRSLVPVLGATTAEEVLSRLDNHGDGKITLDEFLIIANWLFQRARGSATVLTRDDVSRPIVDPTALATTTGAPRR